MSFQFGNTISSIWKKLKKGDYTVRPFEVYKRWDLTTDTTNRNYYQNFGINVFRALYPENHLYFGGIVNISSSLYHRTFTTQSVDPKMIWYHLDHNFYTDHFKDEDPTILTEFGRELYLAESSSVFITPQGVFGEGIRRGSFSFTNLHNSNASLNYKIYDDSRGNLKDATLDESLFVDSTYLLLHTGFDEKYREFEFRNKPVDYVLDRSNRQNDVKVINPKNITYLRGIPTTDTAQSSGVCATFNGAFLDIRQSSNFNFSKTNDFAFSFWINIPPTQSSETYTYNYLFNKNYSVDGDTKFVLKTGRNPGNKYEPKSSAQYPFDITLNNRTSTYPFSISFKQSSGIYTQEVTSSTLTPGDWYHVLCQKTGSNYQIWLDGVLDVSISLNIVGNTNNDNNFFIGSNGTSTGIFSGSLDEIRIYNKALTSTEIQNLADNSFETGYAYQTARIGNIFYKSGIAVVSDPRPKYANSLLGQTGNYDYSNELYGFTGSFRSTTTFYEHEITCKIRKSEFNFTINPSVYKDKNPNAIQVEDYTTSSFFNPYVTTIGLYNDNRDLVAVAKLASPLEKRDDVDMNVIIRFDV
jgi:hypothetical protein